MRLRLLPSHSFRHSRFILANRITSPFADHPELSCRGSDRNAKSAHLYGSRVIYPPNYQ